MENIILSAVVLGLVEGLKRMGISNKIVLPCALIIGIGVELLATLSGEWHGVGQLVLNGLVLGLMASGLYETGKRVPMVNSLLTRGK